MTLDRELLDLEEPLRWREWMGRIEAAIFASPTPVGRQALADLVGCHCVLDDLIADIRAELIARPYDLVAVAGGWQHRTRPRFAQALRQAGPQGPAAAPIRLTPQDYAVLVAVALEQPVGRADLSQRLGQPVSRDTLAWLKSKKLLASGPRLPQPGAPATYVTTDAFLEMFGLQSLAEVRDMIEVMVTGAGGEVDQTQHDG